MWIIGRRKVRRGSGLLAWMPPDRQLRPSRTPRKAALARIQWKRLLPGPAQPYWRHHSPNITHHSPLHPRDGPPCRANLHVHAHARLTPSFNKPHAPPMAEPTADPKPAEPDDSARPSSSHSQPDINTSTKDFVPSREATPPPLPPRPRNLATKASTDSFRFSASGSPRPTLQSKATIALSIPDVQTYNESLRDGISSPNSHQFSISSTRFAGGSDAGDNMSVRSYVPTLDAGENVEKVLGEVIPEEESPIWKSLGHHFPLVETEDALFPVDPSFREAFEREFDELEEFRADGSNEGQAALQLSKTLADRFRNSDVSMEIQVEALSDPVVCWQTHLQPPRR